MVPAFQVESRLMRGTDAAAWEARTSILGIEISEGVEAEKLIGDPDFLSQWEELDRRCGWASVYQGRDFVLCWYDCYRDRYSPLVVAGRDGHGRLVGLFTLAIHTDTGRITAAGDKHAEYQSWLSEPGDGHRFIEAALDSLAAKYPGRGLTLLFVLPGVPVQWALEGGHWADRCVVRTLPRGLMEIGNGDNFRDTLRKKKQSKINRLKRLGNLHLDRIDDPEELGRVFDEVIRFQNLRLRAVYNLPELDDDPRMRDFYVALSRLPRMIHATALRVDNQLVSAQIHMYNREQVLLGRITHSPFFAKYSPGELHTLMTGIELAKEQIPVFDLTPGGSYKDRYATSHDEVFVVKVFFSRAHCLRYKAARKLAEALKTAIGHFKIEPEAARNAYSSLLDRSRKWLGLGPSQMILSALNGFGRLIWRSDEYRIYSRDLSGLSATDAGDGMERDSLADLLHYRPEAAWQPAVNDYLKAALAKLEAGHHLYTRMEGGRLAGYGWLLEARNLKESPISGLDFTLPEESVLLGDFHDRVEGQAPPPGALKAMLRDAAGMAGIEQAFVVVRADHRPLAREVEKAGFTHRESFFDRRLFGIRRKG